MEWVITSILGVFVTVWVFVPEEVLEEKLGIIQFPNRYYILALGNFIGVTVMYWTVMTWATCMMQTHSKDSYFTMQDRHTRLGPAPKRA